MGKPEQLQPLPFRPVGPAPQWWRDTPMASMAAPTVSGAPPSIGPGARQGVHGGGPPGSERALGFCFRKGAPMVGKQGERGPPTHDSHSHTCCPQLPPADPRHPPGGSCGGFRPSGKCDRIQQQIRPKIPKINVKHQAAMGLGGNFPLST